MTDVCFLMIRRPPRSTRKESSAASDVYKRQGGINTDRGNLYANFVETVLQKNPRMFVAENVKGILSANNKTAINQIVEDFSNTGEHGYNTNVHLVNFADYGTPQLRERVLIIGVRKDIDLSFNIPSPSHNAVSYTHLTLPTTPYV